MKLATIMAPLGALPAQARTVCLAVRQLSFGRWRSGRQLPACGIRGRRRPGRAHPHARCSATIWPEREVQTTLWPGRPSRIITAWFGIRGLRLRHCTVERPPQLIENTGGRWVGWVSSLLVGRRPIPTGEEFRRGNPVVQGAAASGGRYSTARWQRRHDSAIAARRKGTARGPR